MLVFILISHHCSGQHWAGIIVILAAPEFQLDSLALQHVSGGQLTLIDNIRTFAIKQLAACYDTIWVAKMDVQAGAMSIRTTCETTSIKQQTPGKPHGSFARVCGKQ